MTKKKASKSSVKGSSTSIVQSEDVAIEFTALLSHLIIGINPYLDISTVHMMLMDVLQVELTEDQAEEAGQMIAKRARISIADDMPGGIH